MNINKETFRKSPSKQQCIHRVILHQSPVSRKDMKQNERQGTNGNGTFYTEESL